MLCGCRGFSRNGVSKAHERCWLWMPCSPHFSDGRCRRSSGHSLRCLRTGATESEAICEAVTRLTMCFVVMSLDQQAALKLHKTRDIIVRQKNSSQQCAPRTHLAGYQKYAVRLVRLGVPFAGKIRCPRLGRSGCREAATISERLAHRAAENRARGR